MTSAEILCNPNMGDPLIAAPMRRSIESFSFNLYTCRLCSRAFSSTQALGGHQTAHRKEKSERLIRLIRQAELDELKYAADNDVVLSPEPISWAPPPTDDQSAQLYANVEWDKSSSRFRECARLRVRTGGGIK